MSHPAGIQPEEFCAELDRRGVGLVTGVPCSYFAGPLRLLEQQPGGYLAAANEGAALAVAAGAELAGTRAAVVLQNSGFGNLVNPLTSLAMPFGIPLLVFMSLRGWPDPGQDEPQHAVMGATTTALLDVLDVPHWILEPDAGQLTKVLDAADEARAEGRPAFVLVPKGTIAAGPAGQSVPAGAQAPFRRREALRVLLPHLADALVFVTTGFLSRELYGLGDRPLTFYMQGSMGHALGLGLGAAHARPDRRVVVVDGDGAVLMHLGTTVTVGATAPANLVHVVLDNAAYESTGSQATTSPAVDWMALARAAGYRSARMCTSEESFTAGLRSTTAGPGPHLVVAKIAVSPGITPPRVTAGLAPAGLRARFAAAVAGHPAPLPHERGVPA
jgi:phosphonopyruvate decarboxylase